MGQVRDLVVIGGSAGGVAVLQSVFATLPADLPAAVLVVTHIPAQGRGALARVLDRSGPLPVTEAVTGRTVEPGRAYVAAPDRHLLLNDGTILLTHAPKQNGVRPAIDALFRSAARWYGARTIGVIVSGALDDGAAGLAAIVAAGGSAVVQDPADAAYPGMPRSALAVVPNAGVHAATALGSAIMELAGVPAAEVLDEPIDDTLRMETDMTAAGGTIPGAAIGAPVALGCPECGGGMSAVGYPAGEYYRCHVGHIYSPLTLLDAQDERAEAGLWAAVSMLEEQATVHRRLADIADRNGAPTAARHRRTAAKDLQKAAEVIRTHFPDVGMNSADLASGIAEIDP